MEKFKINIAQEFNDKLGGRWIKLGPYSGEAFYNEFLKDSYERAREDNERLHIYLDGVKGYGSSFLDQSFGKLNRSYEDVQENLIFHTDFFDWIVEYIELEIWERK